MPPLGGERDKGPSPQCILSPMDNPYLGPPISLESSRARVC